MDLFNESIGYNEYTWISPPDTLQTTDASFLFEDPGDYEIQLLGLNTVNGCRDSLKISVEVLEEPVLYLPNAFTPDGDGTNEVFGVHTVHQFEVYSLMVFNRWGQIVFESTDPNVSWDGSVNGGEYFAPDGVYLYRLQAQFLDINEVVEEEGHVVLIR
ncbi:MAG: gliding motility-associated C-terminal domain-containing protein, partial [Flavobacteriales bacterium]|nr:gliding motility-associated C-terminal domain-containing protein [Flavobacteriales bacterium]